MIGEVAYFYLYDTLPLKLGVHLPFTHFERLILHVLNIVLTQLHPNSWAFVWAFELLTIRWTEKVGWSSLSIWEGRPLMWPFHESYKFFKDQFFRVYCGSTSLDLLTDPAGEPHFPLSWTKQPAVTIRSREPTWRDGRMNL
ncbi:hypothetical protein CR513_48568, partial [Mucuna pruriens]